MTAREHYAPAPAMVSGTGYRGPWMGSPKAESAVQKGEAVKTPANGPAPAFQPLRGKHYDPCLSAIADGLLTT